MKLDAARRRRRPSSLGPRALAVYSRRDDRAVDGGVRQAGQVDDRAVINE